jgi:hypothetical protein
MGKRKTATIPAKLAERWKGMIQRSYVEASRIAEWSGRQYDELAKTLPKDSGGPFVDDDELKKP